MAVKTSRVTVGTSAVLLGAGDTGVIAGSGISVKNLDAAATIYVGGSDVTSSNGYPLGPGDEFASDRESTVDRLYAVAASGSVSVAVIETGA